MFEWFEELLASVNTPKFFLIDGPASDELRTAVENCDFPFPPSYREFVLRFGNAKLFRQGNRWLVEVHAGPREVVIDRIGKMVFVAETDDANAYFKESRMNEGLESPVFEMQYDQKGIRKKADGFEDWLKKKCNWARRKFIKKRWQAIMEGPVPFSEYERAVVQARELFTCRIVGITPNEALQIEITNGSDMTLPYITLGVRGKLRPPGRNTMDGALWLDTSSIHPGSTKIVEKDAYKKLIDPKDIETFSPPRPGPEDRDEFWEFR